MTWTESCVIDTPSIPRPTRADRLRSAASEVQNIYRTSAAKDNVAKTFGSSEGFKIRYDSSNGDSPSRRPTDRATAPVDLKERLRQRAMERTKQSQGGTTEAQSRPRQSQSDGRVTRPRPQSSRASGGPRMPRGRRPDEDERSYRSAVDPMPAPRKRQNFQQLEEPEEEAESNDTVDSNDTIDAGTVAVQLPQATIAMDPKGITREDLFPCGPAFASSERGMREQMAERLVLASRALSGEFVQWANREQREDVLSLVGVLKRRNPSLIKGEVRVQDMEPKNAESSTEMLMQKLFGGSYSLALPQQGTDDVLSGVERMVNTNKSYFPDDESVVVKEVGRILGKSSQAPRKRV